MACASILIAPHLVEIKAPSHGAAHFPSVPPVATRRTRHAMQIQAGTAINPSYSPAPVAPHTTALVKRQCQSPIHTMVTGY